MLGRILIEDCLNKPANSTALGSNHVLDMYCMHQLNYCLHHSAPYTWHRCWCQCQSWQISSWTEGLRWRPGTTARPLHSSLPARPITPTLPAGSFREVRWSKMLLALHTSSSVPLSPMQEKWTKAGIISWFGNDQLRVFDQSVAYKVPWAKFSYLFVKKKVLGMLWCLSRSLWLTPLMFSGPLPCLCVGADYRTTDASGQCAFDYISDYEEWMDCGYFSDDVRARLKGTSFHSSWLVPLYLFIICMQAIHGTSYWTSYSRIFFRKKLA